MQRTQPKFQSFTAVAPSNIALLKYWGKRDAETQWPANDSISMTLSKCKTITTATYSSDNFDTFILDGQSITSETHPDHKIFRHIDRVRRACGSSGHITASSKNTFPSDCGIASSASGFAALTLASVAAFLKTPKWDELSTQGFNRERLAHLARMGSGSAARSLWGGFVMWSAGGSASEQQIEQVWPAEHWDLADIIVVLSSDPKSMKSSDAHQAAWASPLYSPRLAALPERLSRIRRALADHSFERLGLEIEQEALDMHAVCMTGSPQIQYLTKASLDFLVWLRTERRFGRLPAWATIDAGPNIHLICLKQDSDTVAKAVQSSGINCSVIVDQMGQGPSIAEGSGELPND